MLNRVIAERLLAWTSIVCGALLLVLESLYGLLYGEVIQGLVIDYLAAVLLLYAGIQSIRWAPSGAAGLLLGAWSYSLCDVYRGIMWRAEHYLDAGPVEPLREPFAVFALLIMAGFVVVSGFALSLVLAHPQRTT